MRKIGARHWLSSESRQENMHFMKTKTLPNHSLFLLVVLIALLTSSDSHADDLGGLAYLFFVLPLGVVLSLLFIVLGIISIVKLVKKKGPGSESGFGKRVSIVTAFLAALYAALVVGVEIWNDRYKAQFSWSEVATLSIVIVLVSAMSCLVPGIILSRKKGRSS